MTSAEPAVARIKTSPLSSESTSLSSSFVSSAASDMLPADYSSQSDTDHSAGQHKPPARWPLSSSSSPVAMGQGYSKLSSPSENPSPIHKSISLSAAVAGVKLKRAFAARRKRSEDTSNSTSNANVPPPRKLDHRSTLSASAAVSLSGQSAAQVTPRQPKGPKLTLQMATQVLTGGKKSSRTPLSPLPPPLPPKPTNMQGAKLLPPLVVPPSTASVDNRSSIIALSPGISSAVNYMRSQTEDLKEEQERKNATAARKENELGSHEAADKRKSDSTISHHTIRPSATGTRTPRPVSMAESLQTICATNRRSTLVEDGVPEENESFHSVQEEPLVSTVSPTSSLRSKNRRSVSLNISPTKPQNPPPIITDLKQPSKSLPDGHAVPSIVRETPTLTRAAANGIISPSSTGIQSTGNNIRGRLAAWTATNSQQRSQGSSPATNFRHTAMSMSTGLAAPAAGLAKRAVEKMGRWGGFSSSSSTSGYSSSSSSTAPSSFDHKLVRTSSNQSSNRKRRTPDAPSGAWSVNSSVGSSSISDTEAIIPSSGPILGIMVRAPIMLKAPGAAGMVFGRDLKSVVKTTGIGVGNYIGDFRSGSVEKGPFHFLEDRRLPAIVARCAQHILMWGIQEEGLFRVSGRPAHVSKVRNEFDTGADFDMRECSPGELDPHAVASVFKAFLRELPEPILTRSLVPFFDEAVSRESNLHSLENTPSQPTAAKIGGKGPTLPSGPKAGFTAALRKPPSLSTLAMPSFQGMPPPSKPFLNALRSLVAQLPAENRDLLRTVADLITATAKHQKQTKMPLSNLLLVFCPSLNMNPPLLRVLCEADSIWEMSAEIPDPDEVIDIKRDSVVLDISASSASSEDTNDSLSQASDEADNDIDEEFSDAQPTQEPEEVATKTTPPTADQERPPQVVHEQSPVSPAESFRSDSSRKRIGSRPMGPRRQAVPAAIFQECDVLVTPEPDATSDGSHEGVIFSSPLSGALSPPPLSSSAESLSTPASSSAEASLEHLPVEEDEFGKLCMAGPPTIANASECSLPVTPHRPYISGPIQFPTSGSAPSTPLSSRRSIPLLSMPSLGLRSESSSSSANSAPASPRIRLKRPSISLFSKRSASGLNGRPIISAPCIQQTDSESSTSTPQSAVTAPQSSTFVIDTPVDSSPLRFGLGLDIEHSPPPQQPSMPEDDQDPISPVVSPTYQLGTTPIADRFRSDSTLSLTSPPIVQLREKPARQASLASSQIDLLNDEEAPEEWTKSVLLAADRDWT